MFVVTEQREDIVARFSSSGWQQAILRDVFAKITLCGSSREPGLIYIIAQPLISEPVPLLVEEKSAGFTGC